MADHDDHVRANHKRWDLWQHVDPTETEVFPGRDRLACSGKVFLTAADGHDFFIEIVSGWCLERESHKRVRERKIPAAVENASDVFGRWTTHQEHVGLTRQRNRRTALRESIRPCRERIGASVAIGA